MTPVVVALSAGVGAACGPRLRAAVFRWCTCQVGGEPGRCCPRCRAPIPPDRIPRMLAGLPASGRCPACRDRLGPRPGSVEVSTAAVFAVLAVRVDSALLLAALCWFAAPAIALTIVDLTVRRLPDPLTATAGAGLLVGIGITAGVGHQGGALGRALLAGLGLFTGYLALALAGPDSLGFGDCKLAAGLGAVLGWFGWWAVFTGTLAAFALAGGCGLALVALGRLGRRDPIPFGPFMLLGALVAVLAS